MCVASQQLASGADGTTQILQLNPDGTREWVAEGGAPVGASYVTLGTDATLTSERVLTGTANQITVTDGGAGAAVTLSTPQNLHTGATPQFARLGLGAAADSSAVAKFTGQYYSPEVTDTVVASAVTINWDLGTEHYVSLPSAATLTFSNPKAGGRYVLLLQQGGAGSWTVTWPATVLWAGGVAPTLTTTVGQTDLVTFLWSGVLSKYIGNFALNF
jgi:hypothetical protein